LCHWPRFFKGFREYEQNDRANGKMQMGFQHAEQRLNAVIKKMGTFVESVTTVTTLVHNNTLALPDQHEEEEIHF
jgi:hypothetical protein